MTPHTLDTVLQPPQWPLSLSHFVTWCLAWDPKTRPTCAQAMSHEYFADAVDPLRPRSSGSKLLGRKHSSFYEPGTAESNQSLSSKTSSWFRRSLIARDSAPVVPQATLNQSVSMVSPIPQAKQEVSSEEYTSAQGQRPAASKRNTWANGSQANGAPMPILPSIRPISPLSNAVTAQAHAGAQMSKEQHRVQQQQQQAQQQKPKKIGRQLSQASQGNHYADTHRQEAEKALNGQRSILSPTSSQKESFFSHLRKRARRLSGRHQLPMSPKADDIEANPGCAPWITNRNSVNDTGTGRSYTGSSNNFTELDNALQNVKYSLDATVNVSPAHHQSAQKVASNPSLKRHHSLPQGQLGTSMSSTASSSLHPSRSTRRAAQKPTLGTNQYDAPNEQDELLDEALNSAQNALMQIDHHHPGPMGINQELTPIAHSRPRAQQLANESQAPYPTPSPSAKRNSVVFGNGDQTFQPSKPIDIHQNKQAYHGTAFPFPTPPDENEWAAAAAASMGLSEQWRR